MYSVIVCSIDPQKAATLKSNLDATIGVPYEFIAYDNRNSGKGICQVYNECALTAKYNDLCFVHEDVDFLTQDWGKIIDLKLKEDNCGVIGFAGSVVKPKVHTGWYIWNRKFHRKNYIQCGKRSEYKCMVNPNNVDYSEVVTLDGMCLICTKETWQKNKFDESLLRHFHCYDVDFTLSTHHAKMKNYVCNLVMMRHQSIGNMDYKWWTENEIMHEKWDTQLPAWCEKRSKLQKDFFEFKTEIKYAVFLAQKKLFTPCKIKYLFLYWLTHPANRKAIKMIVELLRHKIANVATSHE